MPIAQADLTDELDALLVGDPGTIARSFDLYARMRERGRTYEHRSMVFVTRYADVVEACKAADVLGNGLTSGSHFREARARLSDDERALHDEVQHVFDAFASRRDGESHVAIRNSAHRAFTPRRIAELEVSAAGYARELVDEMVQRGGVVDLMEFAYRLPLRIITDLLGVAEEDRDSVHQWSTLIGGAIGATDSPSMSRAREGLRGIRGYIDRLLAQHRQSGSGATSDLVGLLLAADESGRMGEHELTGMYLQLLFAGHETTTNLIGIGMSELLGNPDQWRAIVERPERVDGAVEELLRYVSPVQFLGRVALCDTVVGGTPVEQGQSVTLLLAAANRDPRRWTDAETLRVSRDDASDHLAFGRGRHFCLGSSLARLEGRIAISELATRVGHMRPVEQTRTWSGGAMLRHLDQLLVDIGPPRS